MKKISLWVNKKLYNSKKVFSGKLFDDFTLITSFLDKYIVEISLIDQLEKSIKESEEEKKNIFEVLINQIGELYLNYTEELKKNPTNQRLYMIMNLSIFFVILLGKVEQYEELYNILFNSNNKKHFWHVLTNFFIYSYNKFNNTDIQNIFYYILIRIYNLKEENISPLIKKEIANVINKIIWLKIPIDDFVTKTSKAIYQSVLFKVKTLDLPYDEMFRNNNYSLEDKKCLKSQFIQSVIRFVLSPQIQTINQNENNFISSFIELTLMKSAVFYINKTGKNYRCILRIEQLYDEIIKFFFFTFGNEFYSSCFFPLINDIYEHDITKENILDFTEIYIKFLRIIEVKVPKILVVVLKIGQRVFSQMYDLEKDNYHPCFMLLFFYFLCSPKMEVIYSFGMNTKINTINKILMNICFNQKFEAKDNKYIFLNDFLTTLNNQTKIFIEKLLKTVEDNKLEEEIIKEVERFNYYKNDQLLFAYDCNVINKLSTI